MPSPAGSADCADTSAPSPPIFTSISLPAGVWTTDNRVTLQWAQAADDTCDIDGYGEFWSNSASACPSDVKDREEFPTTTTRTLLDGIWYFTLKAIDSDGRWSATCARAGPFQVDTTEPGPPSGLRSSSHTPGVWSSNPRIQLLWDAPQELGSGVVGYALALSRGRGVLPEPRQDLGAVLRFQTEAVPDGQDHYVSLRSQDAVGLWGASFASAGPFWIDTVPPTEPEGFISLRHEIGAPSAIRSVVVDWSPSTDAQSGVRGYSVLWNTLPVADPVGTIEGWDSRSTSPALVNGQWWLHVIAVDRAGHRSTTAHVGPFWIAVPAPEPPQVSSGSHTVGECSADCTIDVAWTPTAGAISYSTLWSQAPDAVPNTLPNNVEHAGRSPCLGTGSWYFHIRAVNGAGAWSTAAHAGPFLLDVDPPTSPPELLSSTHAPNRWSPHTSIHVSWPAAEVELCGPTRYSVAFDHASDTLPDAQVETSEAMAESPALFDGGPWYAHVRAVDAVGSPSLTSTHLGPLWIDSTPPAVTLSTLRGDETLQGGALLPIAFAVDDLPSGVESARVEVSLDGGATWGPEIGRAVPPAMAVLWQVPDVDATAVRVRVTARDRAGNEASDQSASDLSIRRAAEPAPALPTAYALGPNVPNPFNPSTRLQVDLPESGVVRVEVVDLRGRVLAALLEGWQERGRRQLAWDGRDREGRPLPSGVYICRLQAGTIHASRKLTILR